MNFPPVLRKQLQTQIASMEKTRAPWLTAWREISDFYLPRRYPWLLTDKETRSAAIRNRRLLDSTSILALRTLATGMMNGITSPARPWFRLRLLGRMDEETPHDQLVWLEEAAKRMFLILAESNFYGALGILYIEWCAFGTASMGIYENFDTVIRCRNYALGEFMIGTDQDGKVNRHARTFVLSTENLVNKFGEAAVPQKILDDYKAGHPRRSNLVRVSHMIEPNEPDGMVRRSAPYREFYWVAGGHADDGLLLSAPLNEYPTVTPRWETYGADEYGSSACMDALPDVIQLQHLVKRRAQALDKTISPPMLVNQMLANRPKSLVASGITYVSGQDLNAGARPAYQIQVPFQEINGDILAVKRSIQQVLFNDLFRMISELDTVRSATEIDARREEKLVLLGPVLERFESEGLSPCIERIFNICLRSGVFPPLPEALAEAEVQIQYVSILSDAQRAVGTVSVERWLQLIGNVAQMAPDEALDIPDWESLIRDYGEAIGVKQKVMRSKEAVEERRAAREEQKAQQQAVEVGGALTSGAQSLSATDVGGGQNALAALLGG